MSFSPESLATQPFTFAQSPALPSTGNFARFLLKQLNPPSELRKAPELAQILSDEATCDPQDAQDQQAMSLDEPNLSQSAYMRRLCVRHKRMVDGGQANEIQKSIETLSLPEQTAVNQVWSQFAAARGPLRQLILQGLLAISCQSQLSFLTEQLASECRSDPLTLLPREISLKIFSNLDAISLCRAAQVSRLWLSVAETDTLWRDMCAQHIQRKCKKCGWGLPLMKNRKRTRTEPSNTPSVPSSSSLQTTSSNGGSIIDSNSAIAPPLPADATAPSAPASSHRGDRPPAPTVFRLPNPLPIPAPRTTPPGPNEPEAYAVIRPDPSLLARPSQKRARDGQPITADDHADSAMNLAKIPRTRPWKSVYSERLIIERNWRKGLCRVQVLSGHTEAVTCMQVEENMSQPDFPILMTGSWDRTARVWNLETGQCLGVMIGHHRGIRALQFDSKKLITGSMDHTLKIWNWRTGDCLRTLTGHTGAVTCLMAHRNLLVSGSADSTIRVWNFDNGTVSPLHGHREWVDKVVIWSSEDACRPATGDPTNFLTKEHMSETNTTTPASENAILLLFSSSDDATIRVWDLKTMQCLRVLEGHIAQVQALQVLTVDVMHRPDLARFPTDDAGSEEHHTIGHIDPNTPDAQSSRHPPGFVSARDYSVGGASMLHGPPPANAQQQLRPLGLGTATPIVISGSLDNQIKFWDVEQGVCTKTLFGHVQGIWDLACNQLRIVSASHDRTLKIWDSVSGKCLHTLVGHRGAVVSCILTDDRVISGSDDADVRVWNFSGN